jgi:hypothetical protein
MRPERPKRERGQGGLSPQSPVSAWKEALSRRSVLLRKTASLFMRPINFLKLLDFYRANEFESGLPKRIFQRSQP